MTSAPIFVAGAVSSDFLLHPMPSSAVGAHPRAGSRTHIAVRPGGAGLVARLLTAAAPQWGFTVHGPTPHRPNGTDALKGTPSALVDLSCDLTSPSRPRPSFDVVGIQHVDRPAEWHSPSIDHSTAPATAPAASTVVITGSGDSFDDVEPALDLLQRVRPSRIVYHMTPPLATGHLWDVIRRGPDAIRGVPGPDHLVVIIDADDLRAEGIHLSQSLSWEATSEDFVRNLGSNGRLDTLVTCPNLVVRFGTEGVIHHRGRDAVDPKLYFEPGRMEGDRAHRMMGLNSAFTAAFTLGFANAADASIPDGIRLGFSAARDLAELGFVADPHDCRPDYPIDKLVEHLASARRLPSTTIPSNRISTGERWSLLDNLAGDLTEVARQVVTLGPEKALARCPVRRFGDLISVERTEQESLGAVYGIIDERIRNEEHMPTCIGVFGPSGAGKTFTASSLAQHLGLTTQTTLTTYDTRSLKEDDLTSACHSIRDSAAVGSLPIACFNNFETVMDSDGDLLNSFSTLMSDGTFLDRGHVRHLGRAVLFFLITQDSADAEPPPPTTATTRTPTANDFVLERRATLERRPTVHTSSDFRQTRLDDWPLLDSLHGAVRVAGPNHAGGGDKTFSIRRALMLRHMLAQRHPHLVDAHGAIDFDDAVLHALLLVPSFKHGLASLAKLLGASRLSGRARFDVAALPPEEQIQLHVDGRAFMSFLRAPKLPAALREALAQGLFETYRAQRALMAGSDEERRRIAAEPSLRAWDELPDDLRDSTAAQADDIPRKLRAIGCFMLNDGAGGAPARADPLAHVPRFSPQELLLLGEMEHERFNAERLQRQWRMGPRNAKQRTTPFLVPWRDLTQEWKDVDTVMVECVPRVLEAAGWRIYRMKD